MIGFTNFSLKFCIPKNFLIIQGQEKCCKYDFNVNSVWWMEAIVILFLVQHRFGNVQKYFLIIFFLQRESLYNVALQEVSIYL